MDVRAPGAGRPVHHRRLLRRRPGDGDRDQPGAGQRPQRLGQEPAAGRRRDRLRQPDRRRTATRPSLRVEPARSASRRATRSSPRSASTASARSRRWLFDTLSGSPVRTISILTSVAQRRSRPTPSGPPTPAAARRSTSRATSPRPAAAARAASAGRRRWPSTSSTSGGRGSTTLFFNFDTPDRVHARLLARDRPRGRQRRACCSRSTTRPRRRSRCSST